MKIAPYDPNRSYDIGLDFVIKTVNDAISQKDDDFLLLNCGFRGSGKSRLTLHLLEAYLKDKASVEFLGLNEKDFANALKKASDSPLPRFCSNDEANISKRDFGKKYNKDLLDLYYSIRGKQIFHVWNNPSLDIIDKKFIEDVIKGVILIVSKDKKRPRIYYYFTKNDILKIWEKYESLSIRLLKKVAKQYAYYRGWFKDYEGKLLPDYMKKKDYRMDEKVNLFHEKYGESAENGITLSQASRLLNVSEGTIRFNLKVMLEKGYIKDSEIVTSAVNKKFLPKDFTERFKKYRAEKERLKVESKT